jgi:hypothetical protein
MSVDFYCYSKETKKLSHMTIITTKNYTHTHTLKERLWVLTTVNQTQEAVLMIRNANHKAKNPLYNCMKTTGYYNRLYHGSGD